MDTAVAGGFSLRNGSKGLVLKALQLLAAAVFAGWLMIWIVMPTNTYRNGWSLRIRAETDSTYFGRQGSNILINTFPILFISVLGCLYLHLVKKSDTSQSSIHRLAAWKRPVAVNWPLGIVSGVELTFCLMFLVLLVWFYSTFLVANFPQLHQTDVGVKL